MKGCVMSRTERAFELACEHEPNGETIPYGCYQSFLELATLDLKEFLWNNLKHWDKIPSAFGTVDLKIDEFQSASSDKKALLDNIIGNFYKENQVSMSFSAAHGIYDEVAKTITLKEEVFIVVEDGTSLKGDELIWQGNDKDILANGNVLIERNGEMVAKAEHAVISPEFDKFKIKGKSSTKIFDK